MNIAQLRLFIAVMRAGGFTAAARTANLDPSSVSRSMAALERSLGVRLFERSTRRFAPTEAGRLYVELVEPLVGELEHAAARTRDLTATPTGTVRLTASVAFGCEMLVPLVPKLRAACPRIALELILSDEPVDLLQHNVDLAIRLGPRPEGDFSCSRLMPVRHRVCASPAYVEREGPLGGPGHLAGRDCIRFPFSGFSSQWRCRDARGTVQDVTVTGSLVVSNALALKQLVMAGLGPGLLADWMIHRELADGRLVDLLPDHEVTATSFDTAAWLLCASRDYVPLKLSATQDFLRSALGKDG